MASDSAQIRRRGAHDFLAYYDFTCAIAESVPLPAVTMNLDRGILDFNGDRIKLTDWPPILDSIAINKHLHHIAISSSYQSLGPLDADRRFYRSSMRRKIPAIHSKDLIFKLSKALRDCLTVSPNLKTLHFSGLPLGERDLIVLTKGLAKSVSLENLSLANCHISDEGLEIICQSVKYSTCIRSVDFTGCNLTWRGAEHMANIIKHQGLQRHGTAWAESLRYRLPHFEKMAGLRRVTLNCNTLIGDRGATALANELAEDLWVKAVDMQKCGLSNEGARRLLETLKTNTTLSVLDVRCNPLIDKPLIKSIVERVLMNSDGMTSEYNWIKPAATEPPRAAGLKKRLTPASFRGKSILRHAAARKPNPSGSSRVPHQKPCFRSRCIPWRTAARAGRQRGLPPGATAVEQSFQGAATVKVTVETNSEDEEEEDDDDKIVVEVEKSASPARDKIAERQFGRLQMELRECRSMLAVERIARLKAETRLKELELENSRLRDTNLSLSEALANSTSAPAAFSALEDEAVLDSIENSFKKFHAFLDLLKDAGLGQLVSMTGLEKSDFQLIGKPQLSSTLGHLNRQVSQRGMSAKCDPTVKAPSPPLLAQKVVISPKSSSSSRASLPESRPLDVTFTPLARPNEVPDASGERTKNWQKHNSSSNRSVSSQKSSVDTSMRKNDQTRSPPPNESPRGSSRHSEESCRRSDLSNGQLSSGSSISEVIGERDGLEGSWGSKKGELVNPGSDSRLRSRGSVSSESDRGDILKQVTTASFMGPQSFSSLF